MPTNTTLAHVRKLILTGAIATSALWSAATEARFLEELASTSAQTTQQRANAAPDTSAAAAVSEGTRLLANRQFDAARQQFEHALELARAEPNREVEGRAYRGLGAALLNLSKYAAAKEALERALTIFGATSAQKDLAQAHRDLGTVEYYMTHMDAARSHYLQALAGFEAVGDVASQAGVCNSLTFVTHDDERAEFTRRGLELARQSGAVETEARLLHSWSDSLFARGRLAEATETLDLAITRFEEAGDGARSNLARALTSLGRLHRAHGHHDQALSAYQRAFTIQQALDDRTGMIQSLTTMAAAYDYLQKGAEARALRERGLALARETESTLLIDTQTAALALDLIDTDDPARGVTMLQDVVARDPFRYYLYSSGLARGYFRLGEYSRAVEAADLAISQAKQRDTLDRVEAAFELRAQAREKLGQYGEALTDVREAIALVERVRSDAVPTDSMKRGFAEQHQWLFTHAIDLLHRLGRDREALAAAEQGRARAFADLLAGRDSSPDSTTRADVPPERAGRTDTVVVADGLRSRGGETPTNVSGLLADRDLRSLASATPLSADELVQLTARLHSTLVSYWVAPDATYVWVVRPSGEITGRRIAVTERRLTELVRQTWMTGDAPLRGEATSGQVSRSKSSAAADIPQADEAWTPRLRGDGLLSLGDRPVVALGALHQLVVAPIQRLLPAERGSLLTILPHGPLFRLSFAALRNSTGQYLVERYAIHYVPAGVVLGLAEQHARASEAGDRRYLLIADPQTLPALPGGKPLPRLPGTRREVSEVAALVPASAATSLVGANASEPRVRSLAGDRSVLHFATHGVIRTDDPLESFLALDTGRTAASRVAQPSGSSDTVDDGRLTAREIYDIQLNADLVVLSACRTGLGGVSGDGVIGLARAFLYAGTPSVVATLWDVADEPAARLMPSLYRSLKRVPDKAQALRNAQLTLLHDLRNGRVSVQTKSGTATLAEHPILWASFILVGRP